MAFLKEKILVVIFAGLSKLHKGVSMATRCYIFTSKDNIEYVYLRKNGKWFVAKLDFKNKQYTPFKEITKAYLDSL